VFGVADPYDGDDGELEHAAARNTTALATAAGAIAFLISRRGCVLMELRNGWQHVWVHLTVRKDVEPTRPGVRAQGVATSNLTNDELIRQLYVEHAGVLLGYTRRLLGGDTARAEDVVQETLLRAWRHPEVLERSERQGTSIRGWLVTVARNIVIDNERARRSRPREVSDSATEDASVDDGAYERVLMAHELSDAMTALSPEHRAVIDELYFGDSTVAVSAARLRVPEGTIKSRAYYGLRALRAACEERGVFS
jgi:RNA polymerase sigma-70 factor (ECF subfamily)